MLLSCIEIDIGANLIVLQSVNLGTWGRCSDRARYMNAIDGRTCFATINKRKCVVVWGSTKSGAKAIDNAGRILR